LTCNFDDLELGQLKVIEGQRSWCHSIVHAWLSIRRLLIRTSYLSPFLNIWPLILMTLN